MGDFPGLTKPALYERELPVTLVLSVPPAGAAVVGMMKLADWGFYLSVFTLAWLVAGTGLKLLQASKKDQRLEESRSPERLTVCLYLMHTALLAANGHPPEDENARKILRVTIHRLDGEEFVQLFDYIGGTNRRETKGRRRSCRSGVIGRAYTTAKPIHFRRADDDFNEYKTEMRERWSMLPQEADELDSERRSHLCVPIGGPDGKVQAVVFTDSSDRDFFNADIQTLVIAQCIGLAQYVWRAKQS